jgi:hypothetical protein
MDQDILQVKYVNKCEFLKNAIRFGSSLVVRSYDHLFVKDMANSIALLSG